ncbi:hypothetical protein PR048_014320 [Dryococelus australis]|uniref:Transposable element Tc3 transposase n=1 Tax=Dryococelus australis TaxID=614101 RepID=A0ABQ9HDZ5_9NEOP|nr:hypothetical protein PR048_014320 [Dryococelus australis]
MTGELAPVPNDMSVNSTQTGNERSVRIKFLSFPLLGTSPISLAAVQNESGFSAVNRTLSFSVCLYHCTIQTILRKVVGEGQAYTLHLAKNHDFIVNEFPVLLEDVPCLQRLEMWFMHDGAPAHFLRNVREHLAQAFNGRWIGRGGPVTWLSRSPGLNSLDLWLWGHLKSLMYATLMNDVQALQERVINACQHILDQLGIFQSGRDSLRYRARGCITMNGRDDEQELIAFTMDIGIYQAGHRGPVGRVMRSGAPEAKWVERSQVGAQWLRGMTTLK